MKAIIVIFSGIIMFFYGCKETINNNSFLQPVYYEILTISLPDNYTVKLYSSDSDSLTYSYNEVHFKVWQNNAEQNTGYLKVYPKMRMTPHIEHSTPVSDSFAYNNASGYYSGFIIFNMPTSPPDLVWRTRFTFIDNNSTSHETDSIPIYISYHPEKQLKYFYDLSDTTYYTLTLVNPFNPLAGLCGLELLLHKSNVYELEFEQIRDGQMYINVYKQDSLYSTSGNTNPVISPDGIYRGIINVPHKGLWIVADTIFYNGRIITNNPPPLPEININIE